MLTLRPLPVGTRLGLLHVVLENAGTSVLTLRSAAPAWVTGRGVLVLEELEISPDRSGLRSVPSGVYTSDPPVYYSSEDGRCHDPLLRPLPGFEILPGATARVWMVVRAVDIGTYRMPGLEVTYDQRSSEVTQRIDIGVRGRISPDARPLLPDRTERPCLTSRARTSDYRAGPDAAGERSPYLPHMAVGTWPTGVTPTSSSQFSLV